LSEASKPDIPALIAALQASVPAAMRERAQWLVWRFEAYAGDKKPRKVPYYAGGGKRGGTRGQQLQQGSPEDRAKLVTFDVALARLAQGARDGLGFAFLPGDGLIGIDIDAAVDLATGEVSERCTKIIEACNTYTELSPSGTGVHIIAAGTTDTTKSNAIGLEVYCGKQFFTVTGRRWSGTPAEVNPIDEKVIKRLQATVQAAKGGAARTRPPAPQVAPDDDIERRLADALQCVSASVGYHDWLNIGMGLKAALGDRGFALWNYWSSKGDSYPGTEALDRKWHSFQSDGVTEATVFKLATQAGWKPPRARKRPVAAAPPRSEPSPDPPPAEPASAEQSTPLQASGEESGEVDSGGAGDGDEGRGAAATGGKEEHWRKRLKWEKGKLLDCRENVFFMLSEHPKLQGLVAYDQFAHRVLKTQAPPWDSEPGEWTNNDDYELGLWLSTRENLTIKGEGVLAAGVAMAAFRARFHPVKDWLNGLKWDGTERLAHWLHECLGADDKTYHRMVGTFFLTGLVARILDPGCQMDHMIVLEGPQGYGKSSALRILAGQWYADTAVRIGDKDALLNLAGVLIYEVGELDSFNKAEVTAVKMYISSRTDRVREPYTRRPVDRPRSCCLAGSTNQNEYFKDPTGSRRFWPVAVPDAINLDKLREWREQLFAEAVHRFRASERHFPTRAEEQEYFWPEQDDREIVDPWFERVAIWIDLPEQAVTETFLCSEILTRALHVAADRIDGARNMATRVGSIMHKLGWTKRRDATGARLRRYVRPKPGAARQEGQKGPSGEVSGGPTPQWQPQDWEDSDDR
jgi:putative DNA primase/helicase